MEFVQLVYLETIRARNLFYPYRFLCGIKAQDRIDQKNFNRGLLALLAFVGVILIIRAVTQDA